jgi:hypothetical protein
MAWCAPAGADMAQKTAKGGAGQDDLRPGMVTRIFDRVRMIKLKYPESARKIDGQEARIRDCLMTINDSLDDFPNADRELIKVLVINGVHKMCDEILIDDPEESQE